MNSPPATRHAVLRLLKKHNVKAWRYLDLGCGDGSFTLEIADLVEAREIVGVDISEQALTKAQGKVLRRLR